MTLLLLWEEYRAEHIDGYGYIRFCDLYRDWCKTISPTRRQTHGPPRSCLSTLRATRCRYSTSLCWEHPIIPYAEARWSEGLADWIGAHVTAFSAIDGPLRVVRYCP